MPVANIFDLIDRGDLSDLTLVEESLDGHIEGSVTQDMAHSQRAAGLVCGFHDGAALLLGVAHGLLQQDVVALLHSFEGGSGMVVIQCADERTVRESGAIQQLFPAFKTVFRRNVQLIRKTVQTVTAGLSDGDDLKLIRMLLGVVCVNTSTVSGAQHNGSNRFHSKDTS